MGTNSKKTTAGNESSFIKKHHEGFYYVADIALNAIIIIGLVLLIRTYIISPFQVSGKSMCDSLNFVNGECLTQQDIGEYIIIDKFSYNFINPERGDIIVFKPPINKKEYYVKRIIAYPGEEVQIKEGRVWIRNTDYPEGFFLDEPYLNERNQGKTTVDKSMQGYTYKVPENHYFVMGDNRNGSNDSRHWRDPVTGELDSYVSSDQIEGKVWVVLWPFSNLRLVKHFHNYLSNK